jgi:coenzyme F420-reducing hydrogenase beta subunit
VVTSNDDPFGGQFVIITDPADLGQSSSSKYAPIHFGKIFNQVRTQYRNRKLVMVGRPCQLRALQKAEKVFPVLKEIIVFKVSIFCAWQISRKGVEFLGRLSKVNKTKKVDKISFRKVVWPGNLTFETEDKAHAFPFGSSDHTYGTYYYPAIAPFMTDDCRHCYDVTGKLADVSCGDPWNLGLAAKNGAGFTMSIVRSEKAEKMFAAEGFKDYVSQHHVISKAQMKQSQGNTVKVKKAGVYLERYQCSSDEISIRAYNMINRWYAQVVRKLPFWMVPNMLVRGYLKLVWTIHKKRLDKAQFIEAKGSKLSQGV